MPYDNQTDYQKAYSDFVLDKNGKPKRDAQGNLIPKKNKSGAEIGSAGKETQAPSVQRQYQYSFSGADADSYVYFPDLPEQIRKLESLHTVSFSVHEAKGQVRTLGYRGIRGLTRSIRTIAGSMIFLVVRDHPLRDLIGDSTHSNVHQGSWSVDMNRVGVGTAWGFNFTNRLPTLMPPFNMLTVYMAELSRSKPVTISGGGYEGAAQLLQGIEFVDDGMVTSVNDIVSEMTFSFIARDFKPISLNEFDIREGKLSPDFEKHAEQEREQGKQQIALKEMLYGTSKHGLMQENWESHSRLPSRKPKGPGGY